MSMNANLSILIEAVNQTSAPFKEAEAEITKLASAREYANRVVFEQQRAEALLAQQYRYQYRGLYDAAEIMNRVGSIGMQLLSISNSRAIAELRLSDAVDTVADAEARLNMMRELYGEDSVQYLDALGDLEDANKSLAEAEKAHDYNELYTGLALFQVAGTSLQTILTVGEKIAAKGGIVGFLGGAAGIAALTTALVSLAAGLATVGSLAYLGTLGGPDTPSNFNDLLPDGMELTKEDIENGKTYEDAYAEWRALQELGATDGPSTGAEKTNSAQSNKKTKKSNKNSNSSTTKEDAYKAASNSATVTENTLYKVEVTANDVSAEDKAKAATAKNQSTILTDGPSTGAERTISRTIIQNNTIKIDTVKTDSDSYEIQKQLATITKQAAKEAL